MQYKITVLVFVALLVGCSSGFNPMDDYEPVSAVTVMSGPSPDNNKTYDASQVTQGKYMVELLGCGACHTDGALIGDPNPDRLLAGSRVGIARSNPLAVANPGVVFPGNLTPDVKTGIGSASNEQLARAIRSGVGRHGMRSIEVMPIAAYARVKNEDVDAIIAYLRSIPAVEYSIPEAVSEGQETDELYIHFGVYRNRER